MRPLAEASQIVVKTKYNHQLWGCKYNENQRNVNAQFAGKDDTHHKVSVDWQQFSQNVEKKFTNKLINDEHYVECFNVKVKELFDFTN